MTIEQNNRILLLLLGSLVLLIFMDLQARRHYNSLAGRPDETGVPSRDGSSDSSPYLTPLPRTVRESVENIMGEEFSGERSGESSTPSLSADEIFNREAIDPDATHSRDPGETPSDGGQTLLPVKGDIELFFIRFRNGRSRLVRVRRSFVGDAIRPVTLLSLLQKGPAIREKGLLNAFDDKVKLLSVRTEGESLVVDLSASVGKNSAAIIRDRLDQLVFTATQFPRIKSVRILVEGKSVRELGEARVPVPAELRRSDREITEFGP